MPGFGTATEAFQAYDAGARYLKLFPASTYGPGHVKALKAVLPADAVVMAVGGAGPSNMAEWWAAGARGFGLGSDLYKPGQSPGGYGAEGARRGGGLPRAARLERFSAGDRLRFPWQSVRVPQLGDCLGDTRQQSRMCEIFAAVAQ